MRIERGQPLAAESRTQYMSPSKEIPDTVGVCPSGPDRPGGLERYFGLTLKPRIAWSTSAVQVAPEPRARHDRLTSFFTDHLSDRRPWLSTVRLRRVGEVSAET